MSHQPNKSNIKILSDNRKASFLYEILEKYEAGIALYGPEIKSIKSGKVNLSDGYVVIKNGEALLLNVHISPYEKAVRENKDPLRTRVLLLHKNEIMRLYGKTKEKNLTIIPLKIYLKSGRAKVEIALVKGKKIYDKRASIKEKEQKREVERIIKSKR
ncbi:MAG: SsrA-binding protein SmpB [Candidatus Acidulodesulfobacterium ferriphilum]|uniref:SsrA-binding protein n=1 Tax=Candidatus Acidulodesulfobacterium ferriphilum TaxID=2597223 RepID=A0A519BCD5_9DELT|nr:MAG: SsrA-binding protein SmpB [Candidatus Acidulodesulfobacterium ferriphilum]